MFAHFIQFICACNCIFSVYIYFMLKRFVTNRSFLQYAQVCFIRFHLFNHSIALLIFLFSILSSTIQPVFSCQVFPFMFCLIIKCSTNVIKCLLLCMQNECFPHSELTFSGPPLYLFISVSHFTFQQVYISSIHYY